ncbi:ABC transporter permease [Tahibacter sp.]|uniref:MlaE family ABC transporter permease n=1 Tax=Tahibacter sp. TaxID=2056211 RepID=UPI0028C409E8|nr:ABC transporter permease [Tahibacter sp.]
MAQKATVSWIRTNGRATLAMAGDWTLANAQDLAPAVAGAAAMRPGDPCLIDAHRLTALDTTGALLLLRALGDTPPSFSAADVQGMNPANMALLRLVSARHGQLAPARPVHASFVRLLERIGGGIVNAWHQARELLGFVGMMLATLGKVLSGHRRLRLTATVFHMEQTGLDAVPIVTLLSFLVGAVVAFLGATVLRDFGAEVFTVELVSYSFLREFGVLLTAILIAGRSGSAFTAQIGSMKSREELDAIQALGLDPIELLVIPRLLALLVMLPALTFLGMLAGLVGGGLVGVLALDFTPAMFIGRLHEMTELRHFWVGMAKAPVFAFLIAAVGCLEGFKVEGSAESVGRHTTASVVQSIFLVIVFDAAFAIFFMELQV